MTLLGGALLSASTSANCFDMGRTSTLSEYWVSPLSGNKQLTNDKYFSKNQDCYITIRPIVNLNNGNFKVPSQGIHRTVYEESKIHVQLIEFPLGKTVSIEKTSLKEN